MNLHILAHGHAAKEGLDRFRQQPAFRKATRAMLLACASIEAAFEAQPGLRHFLEGRPQRCGLVMGSAFGELETTKDFLTTLADTGMARPLLFQNSLHNSTTGFASIHFSFTGPVLTTSHGIFVAEHSLELASLLLARDHCDVCFVTVVDTFLPELGAGPLTASDKSEGAVTLVLSRGGRYEDSGLKSSAVIERVVCHRETGSSKLSYGALFLSAEDTIDKLLTAAGESGLGGSVRIEKPGQSYSQIQWSRV